MKKFKIKLIAACVGFLFLSVSSASAQRDFKVGAFLAYGSEIENPGIGVNAELNLINQLSVSPSFIYYFPKGISGFDINMMELNANANYYFIKMDPVSLYGLAGLNYTFVDYGYDTGIYGSSYYNDSDSTDGNLGLNIGGGAAFNIGGIILPFAELKYVIMDGGQLVIAAGAKINL